jgi:hypothetical protein
MMFKLCSDNASALSTMHAVRLLALEQTENSPLRDVFPPQKGGATINKSVCGLS